MRSVAGFPHIHPPAPPNPPFSFVFRSSMEKDWGIFLKQRKQSNGMERS